MIRVLTSIAVTAMTITGFAQMDSATRDLLVAEAQEAREKAYAPYSEFLVGSALLLASGEIVTGCNVENASYGLTCCAERTAIFKAVSEGLTQVIAVAVVAKNGAYPCGACRQVLNEFGPTMKVIIADETGTLLDETTLDALLPHSFGPVNILGSW